MSCASCKKVVVESVLCRGCNNVFYYACAGITESTYRKMGVERRAAWRCVTCRQETPAPPSQSSPPTDTIALSDLLKELKGVRDDFGSLKADFQSVKADINNSTQAIQSLTTKWNDLEYRINGMEDRFSLLEERFDSLSTLHKNLEKANETISELRHDLELQDQFSRLNNIEISGIPSKNGENLYGLLNDICAVVGFQLEATDVDTIHRVRPYNAKSANDGESSGKTFVRPPSIVVRFTQRRRKDQLIAACRARRGITTADIKINGPAFNIYVMNT